MQRANWKYKILSNEITGSIISLQHLQLATKRSSYEEKSTWPHQKVSSLWQFKVFFTSLSHSGKVASHKTVWYVAQPQMRMQKQLTDCFPQILWDVGKNNSQKTNKNLSTEQDKLLAIWKWECGSRGAYFPSTTITYLLKSH